MDSENQSKDDLESEIDRTTLLKRSITCSNESEIYDLKIEVSTGDKLFIIGANGTGKSSLLHHLWKIEGENVIRIDAQRHIGFQSGEISMTASHRARSDKAFESAASSNYGRYFIDMSYHHGRISAALFDLVEAEAKRNEAIVKAYESGVGLESIHKKGSPVSRINKILRSAQLPFTVEIDGIRAVRARRDGGPPFDIACLSDGQRAGLLLAATVLTADQGTVFLIDEPERHLHRAISAALLRDLFQERPDCAFVVATHDIELVSEHSDAQILITRDYWLSETGVPAPKLRNGLSPKEGELWVIDRLEAEAALPEQVRRDILGSRRRVLFVEGIDTSLDGELYKILFPEVSIVPKGTAYNVIAATRAVHGDVPLWLDVQGLIDRDERDETTTQKFLAEGIHSLTLNAVEGVYLHPSIIAGLANRQSNVVQIDAQERTKAAIKAAKEVIQKDRDRLCARAIEVAIRDEAKSKIPTWSELLAGDPAPISVEVEGRMAAERAAFDKAARDGDITPLLARYKIRETSAAAKVAEVLKFKNFEDYRGAAQKMLKEEPALLAEMQGLAPTLKVRWFS